MFFFFEEEPRATNVAENNESQPKLRVFQKSWQIADKNGFLLKQAKMFNKTSAKALHVFFLTTISLLPRKPTLRFALHKHSKSVS